MAYLNQGLAYYPRRDYTRFYIFLTQSRLGQTEQAQMELNAYVHSFPASKMNGWQASIAQFLLGNLDEKEFLSQATTKAKRPTDIQEQICESYYYSGMKHLLTGDKAGAAILFQKCLDTGEDNDIEYKSSRAELRALKNPQS